MTRRLRRLALTCVAVLGTLGLGDFSPASTGLQPRDALALDETITTCDWATFKSTLDAVQADGGGTITFDCSGTIKFPTKVQITSSVTLVGNGQVVFDRQGGSGLFENFFGHRLTLIHLTLQNSGHNTAIRNLNSTVEIIGSTFRNNRGGEGGAILNSGDLTVIDSVFMNNSVSSETGAPPFWGGAISSVNGTLTVVGSTFANNNGDISGGAIRSSSRTTITASTFVNNSAADGGAITLAGSQPSTITASTFTGNTSTDAGPGGSGAIYNTGTLVVTASTITGNQSHGQGGGINTSSGETTTLRGSIVALNTASSGPDNCGGNGTYISEGSNLSDNDDCGFSTIAGDILNSGNIDLDDLADYGGPTMTMPPMTGSDAIDNAGCGDSSEIDQRGVVRPVGAGCDIGAVEVGGIVPAVQILSVLPRDDAVDEGQTVEILTAVHAPEGASLEYRFDCDDDQQFETLGDAHGMAGIGSCLMTDDGLRTIGVQVCDDAVPANCDTATMTVNVEEVAPSIDTPVVDPSPSDEGVSVTASATFDATDALGCTVDYGDGSGPLMGTLTAGDCTGPAHTYVDGDNSYIVTIEVCDEKACDSESIQHQVLNVAPEITQVTASSPVSPGEPVTVTVVASDPGVSDTLMYGFDCDHDGFFEVGPQPENSANCPGDESSLTLELVVQVSDGSVAVEQSVTLSFAQSYCAKADNGQLRLHADGCRANEQEIVLGPDSAEIFCANPGNGQLRYRPGGCPGRWQTLIVPGDEPIETCQHIHAGLLRLLRSGSCGPQEILHIIPAG